MQQDSEFMVLARSVRELAEIAGEASRAGLVTGLGRALDIAERNTRGRDREVVRNLRAAVFAAPWVGDEEWVASHAEAVTLVLLAASLPHNVTLGILAIDLERWLGAELRRLVMGVA